VIKAIYLHPNADLEYFREKHLAMTKALPGLRKFTIAVAMADPVDGSPPAYNLVNEVYFDDVESYKAAFASDEIKVALGDVPNFSDPARVLAIVAAEEDIPL
jgi:uncharacterized protein (TIGR02118 family)